ncbi:MAG: hypothetical protein PHR35_09405 [Kiritimatiellae bacterium]|nr:hypothetical protein [Kiritimatiellia bacterium]
MKNHIATIALCLLSTGLLAAGKPTSHYWDLGVGSYGASGGKYETYCGLTMLDRARMDWVYLCFGNEGANPEMLNEYLKMNPNLKILVRLWPIIYKYDQNKRRSSATFMDYLYEEGIKEKMFGMIDSQVKSVLDHIDKPAAVYGFTFIEELPFHFSDYGLDETDPNKIPGDMLKYKAKFEADTGGKLTAWDAGARRWWSVKFAQAMEEINRHIKEVTGNKRVFIYIATHYKFLDWVQEGEDLCQWRLFQLYWKDLVKPGVCDGFFAYNNNSFWNKRYTELADKLDCSYFSQLSQCSGMRLASWEETVRLAETKNPHNLGYFLYITGGDKEGLWNDDPSIPDNDNFHRTSIPSHTRRYCAAKKVGMDVIARELRPRVQIVHELGKTAPGQFASIRLLIENPRDLTWFADPAEAELRNLKVKLETPPEFDVPESNSGPRELTIARLAPGKHVEVLWYAKNIGKGTYSGAAPLRVTVATDNALPAVFESRETEVAITPERVLTANASGQSWNYPAYHLKEAKVSVQATLECLRDCATLPSLSIFGSQKPKIIWNGCLRRGQKLVVGPGLKAVLYETKTSTGTDVTDKLMGMPLLLNPSAMNVITYTDEDPPTGGDKVKITIEESDATAQ